MDSVGNCRLIFTLDEFEKYCNDVADTAAWGGQLEVRIPDIYPNNKQVMIHQPFVKILFFFINMFIFSSWQLKALSQVLQLPIEVIQAESPPIIIGEEYDKPPITLM